MNGAQLLAQELRSRGVTFIALLCGHGLDPFSNACLEAGIRLVDVRNEQAAGYIAECYGRLTRQPGICAASSGVAHVNALTGVLNAYYDGAPMLLISGSGALRTAGMGHFQDLDQVALATPICTFARVVDHVDVIDQYIAEAWSEMQNGRPGPVHLTLPLDIQNQTVRPPADRRKYSVVRSQTQTDQAQLLEAARAIAAAQRPLLIAGSGMYYAHGEEALQLFTETTAIPVTTPIWDRGSVPKPLDTWVGVLGAATGGPLLLPEADVVILAGAECDYRVGYLQSPGIADGATLIRIDSDYDRINKGTAAHISIQNDPAVILTRIAELYREQTFPQHSEWLQEARSRYNTFRANVRNTDRSTPDGRLHALDIIEALEKTVDEETVLVVDGGNIGQWVHQTLADHYPGHWLTCGISAVVGFGLPGAMAARLAYPDRKVILISGDGAFGFTVAELEAATRQNLPFVIIVADDEAWGISLTSHERVYGKPLASTLSTVRYDQVARGFGADGAYVTEADKLVPEIQKGLASDKPYLIHVPLVRSQPSGAEAKK